MSGYYYIYIPLHEVGRAIYTVTVSRCCNCGGFKLYTMHGTAFGTSMCPEKNCAKPIKNCTKTHTYTHTHTHTSTCTTMTSSATRTQNLHRINHSHWTNVKYNLGMQFQNIYASHSPQWTTSVVVQSLHTCKSGANGRT